MRDLPAAPSALPVPIDRLAQVILGQAAPNSVGGHELRGLAALVAFLDPDVEPDAESRVRSEALRLATTHLVIEETAQQALEVLERAGQRPVLLKGLALAPFYPRPDLRPTGDVDLLVLPEHLDAARSALETAGWRSVVKGRWAEDYQRREGYCWQAVRENQAVLELHYRLWGSVARGYGAAVVESAVSIDGGRRPCLEDLVVIAASHAWRQEVPRRGSDFVDVALVLAREPAFDYSRLLHRTDLSGQALPVALCLRALGGALPQAAKKFLEHELVPRLRGRERRFYRRTSGLDVDQIRWSKIRLSMLLAGRPARIGWKAVWRRVWPHPHFIEQSAAGRPWWLHRLLRLLGRSG